MIKRKLLARYEGMENSIYPAESQRSARLLDGSLHFGVGAGLQHQDGDKDGAPKSYKDLLNAKWKGAIAMDNEPYNWLSFRCAIWNSATARRRRRIT